MVLRWLLLLVTGESLRSSLVFTGVCFRSFFSENFVVVVFIKVSIFCILGAILVLFASTNRSSLHQTEAVMQFHLDLHPLHASVSCNF